MEEDSTSFEFCFQETGGSVLTNEKQPPNLELQFVSKETSQESGVTAQFETSLVVPLNISRIPCRNFVVLRFREGAEVSTL